MEKLVYYCRFLLTNVYLKIHNSFMRRLKTFIVICAVIFCTFSFSACGKVSSGPKPSTEETDSGKSETGPSVTSPKAPDDDRGNYSNPDNQNLDEVVSILLAEGVYFQTLYMVGEAYNEDIKITEVLDDGRLGDTIDVDSSIISNFPDANFVGEKTISILYKECPPITINFCFIDLCMVDVNVDISIFQERLSFEKLILKYSHVGDDGNEYFREQALTNYKYNINGVEYANADEFNTSGLFTNVSIIDESGNIVKSQLNLIIGEITETLTIIIGEKAEFESEINALFYLFIYQVYEKNHNLDAMPFSDSDVWNRVVKNHFLFDLAELSDFDNAFESFWPNSQGSFAADCYSYRWQNFKKAVAHAYRIKLCETSPLVEIKVYCIKDLIIYCLCDEFNNYTYIQIKN